MNDLKVAVVILNWNGVSFLQKFLPGVIQNSSVDGVAVIVADNGSTDDSVNLLKRDFPEVRLVELDRNYGYAGGYNLALKQIDADYYVLLNSDVEVPEGWLLPLIDFMDSKPQAGACMPKLLDYSNRNKFEYAGAAGGFIDSLGYPFCRGRILSVIEEDTGQYDRPLEVFWASGACMFVRATAFWAANGLDDDFFAHMEEIDLCWRMKNLGYSVWCIPASKVFHVGGGTLPNNNPRKLYFNYRNSLFMLYKNLPLRKLWRILFTRLILDWASGIVYFFTGRFAYAGAVVKAHYSFWQSASKMKEKRISLVKQKDEIKNYLHKSILFEFFIKRRKKFNELS